MNIDPSTNLVVFEIKGHGEPHVMSGRTRDEDCIQRAWLATPVTHRTAAPKVTRIYSEWQPSVADAHFIRRTFPNAAVTYSFERPGPDGWDAAFAVAARTIAQAESEQEAERASQNMHHVAENGELLPILWSRTSPNIGMLQFLPHRDVVPGRLHLALAAVAPTPQGRIGMNHLTFAQLGDRPFEDVVATTISAFTNSLRVDGHSDRHQPDKGHLLVLRREGPLASSAVALPDFHEQMSAALGDGRLIVGLPDPDTVLVTRADSGWVNELHQAVLTSPCPSGELVPTVLGFDPAGPRLLAERSEPWAASD